MAQRKIVKKKSKIVRKKPGTKSNMYFNEATTAAIIEFQKSTDKKRQEELYNTEIYPAFDKLAENLVSIHRFQSMFDTYSELKKDCVTFLYEAIHKFDHTRGTLPFSYFNVVAKNWLIIRAKQRTNKLKKSVSIDDDALSTDDRTSIENHRVAPAPDDQFEEFEFVFRVRGLLKKIKHRVSNENEQRCIDAIIQIFDRVDDLSGHSDGDIMLNKRAVFQYMREYSELTPKQLTMTISSLKKIYRELKNDEVDGIY